MENTKSAGTALLPSSWGMFLFFLTVFSLCYASALLTSYGFSDDYPLLGGALRGELLFGQVVAGGRPVYAILLKLFFSWVRDIDDLRYGRIFSVVGIAWVALHFYRALIRQGWTLAESVLVTLIVCTLPSFQVYAAWATVGFYVYAVLAASGAWILLERALGTPGAAIRWGLTLAAFFLQLVAITIHQSAAMFFWVFAALRLGEPESRFRDVWHRLGWYSLFMGGNLLCGFGVHKLAVILYGLSGLPQARSTITVDWEGKLDWFLHEPLKNALGGFFLWPSDSVSLVVALVIGGGLGLYFHGGMAERLRRGLILLLLLPASYAPNLVVMENWASYRTLPALSGLVVVYGFFALQGYQRVVRRFFPVPLTLVTLSGCVLVATGLAAYNVHTRFATLQFREMEFVRARIARAEFSHVSHIFVIGLLSPQWQGRITSIVHYDEFDLPSSARDWSPRDMVFLLLREMKPEYVTLPITLAPPDDAAIPPADSLVIDMREHFRDYLIDSSQSKPRLIR
ncbi:MAG: hypothetical protein HOP18_18900 [Deltaproteobacteria bacterium]|nr:hypothetical protein [Deltaproteobacteria bacterium]